MFSPVGFYLCDHLCYATLHIHIRQILFQTSKILSNNQQEKEFCSFIIIFSVLDYGKWSDNNFWYDIFFLWNNDFMWYFPLSNKKILIYFFRWIIIFDMTFFFCGIMILIWYLYFFHSGMITSPWLYYIKSIQHVVWLQINTWSYFSSLRSKVFSF